VIAEVVRILRFSLVIGALCGVMSTAQADPFADMLGRNAPPNNTRSLFDHLMFKKDAAGGYSYQIPGTFEALIRELSDISGKTKPTIVMFPDGRSLQRKAASYRSPRIVVAFNQMPQADIETKVFLKDRLYIGFVPDAHQMEVISYNEEAGRFEYQLVLDYESPDPLKKPRVIYAQRAFCMACHQSAGTLFSKQPWMESNGATNGPHAISPVNEKLKQTLGTTKYRGVDILVQPDPYEFNNSTDLANSFLVWQRLWREGCGLENNEQTRMCRARILLQALGGLLMADRNEWRDDYTKLVAYWTESTGTNGRPGNAQISLLYGAIANRDPEKNDASQAEETTGVSTQEAGASIERLRVLANGTQNQRITDLLADSDFPAGLDPLALRRNYWYNPNTQDRPRFNEQWTLDQLIDGIKYGYFSDSEFILFTRVPFASIKAAVFKLAALANGPFGPENFRRSQILGQLFAELNIPVKPICCDVDKDMPPVVAETDDGAVVIGSRSDPMALFRGYCGRCHEAKKVNNDTRLSFFPDLPKASTLEGVIPDDWLQFLSKGGMPCARLNWENSAVSPMPPIGVPSSTYGALQGNSADRKEMLANYKAMATKVAASGDALRRMAGMPLAVELHKDAQALKTMLTREVIDNVLCVADPSVH
jgi:hypothetical protein